MILSINTSAGVSQRPSYTLPEPSFQAGPALDPAAPPAPHLHCYHSEHLIRVDDYDKRDRLN